MRLGFILGFLIGGGIATLLGQAHGEDDVIPSVSGSDSPASGNALKQHVSTARDAAKEAQLEKEAEMLRLYDAMVHRKEPPEA
jgi:hypothetical protein